MKKQYFRINFLHQSQVYNILYDKDKAKHKNYGYQTPIQSSQLINFSEEANLSCHY